MYFQPAAVTVLLAVSISADDDLKEGQIAYSSQERPEESKDNETVLFVTSSPPLPSEQLFSTDVDTTAHSVSPIVSASASGEFKLQDGVGTECPCPCNDRVSQPVCGQTTFGQSKTFPSECHLICYNICTSSVRYALVRSEACLPPVYVGDVLGQPSFLSSLRRAGTTSGPEWVCDCSYCPAIDKVRPDYYPICAERLGRYVTFDSWCHFDCENRCYEHTKQPHIFLHRGPCIVEPQLPVTYPVHGLERDGSLCNICADQCRGIHAPVCARGALGQHLPFKSRCHLRCHNQCNFFSSGAQYYQVHDGDCRWLRVR